MHTQFFSLEFYEKYFTLYEFFLLLDDLVNFISPGDTNADRMQFTLTGDFIIFDVKACSDVWVTIWQIPGDTFELRYLVYDNRL